MSKGSRTIEVTTSQINEFKNCRRRYWFSYRELLTPKQESEPLVIGSSYHAKVEEIFNTGTFTESNDYTDCMARAFMKFILPQISGEITPEVQFRERLARGIYLKGKIDGVGDGFLVEHKTTGKYIDDEYEYRVNYHNDQVSNYLIATGKNIPVVYTVCMKPSIRIKKNETLEEYLKRCDEWYEEDTARKIKVFTVYRTDEELKEQKENLIWLAREIKKTHQFYRNDMACSILSCPFSGICNTYESGVELADFRKKYSVNEELEEKEGGIKQWL